MKYSLSHNVEIIGRSKTPKHTTEHTKAVWTMFLKRSIISTLTDTLYKMFSFGSNRYYHLAINKTIQTAARRSRTTIKYGHALTKTMSFDQQLGGAHNHWLISALYKFQS